jgi:hypothetical protein
MGGVWPFVGHVNYRPDCQHVCSGAHVFLTLPSYASTPHRRVARLCEAPHTFHRVTRCRDPYRGS